MRDITSDKVLHYWGKLTSGVVDSQRMHEFPNAVKAVCGGSFVAYIDTNKNLWVAGSLRLVKDFGSQPYLYAQNVKDIAYGNGTLYYVTGDESLYGVGSDRGNALMGKCTKSNRYSEYYTDTPIHLGYNVSSVYAGDMFALALLNTGLLGGWGAFSGNSSESHKSPVPIDWDVKMASVSGSGGLPIYLKNDGSAWYLTSKTDLKKVQKFADNVKTLDGRSNRGYYIDNDGILYGFGSNYNLRLGDFETYLESGGDLSTNQERVVEPENAVRIKEQTFTDSRFSYVSVAGKYAMALRTNGDIFGWGQFTSGEDFDNNSELWSYTDYPWGTGLICPSPQPLILAKKNPILKDVDTPQEIIISIGEQYIIPVKTIPIDATFTDYEWESSDNEIAAVDRHGLLWGVNPGECLATVKFVSPHTSIEKSIKIKVTDSNEGSVDGIPVDKTDSCTIYNMQGAKVFSGRYFDRPTLPNGIYIVRYAGKAYKIRL